MIKKRFAGIPAPEICSFEAVPVKDAAFNREGRKRHEAKT